MTTRHERVTHRFAHHLCVACTDHESEDSHSKPISAKNYGTDTAGHTSRTSAYARLRTFTHAPLPGFPGNYGDYGDYSASLAIAAVFASSARLSSAMRSLARCMRLYRASDMASRSAFRNL